MIDFCENCKVEFQWREDPGVETFDIAIQLFDTRQIMAIFFVISNA